MGFRLWERGRGKKEVEGQRPEGSCLVSVARGSSSDWKCQRGLEWDERDREGGREKADIKERGRKGHGNGEGEGENMQHW